MLGFFETFEILSKFSRKVREKFWKYGFVRRVGGGAPKTTRNIKELVEKSMETCKILKNFHGFLANFTLVKANFNKN